MTSLEEAIRNVIKMDFGSIPKFAQEIEEPATSVYGALSRGMKNTRTELTDKMYRALKIDMNSISFNDDVKLKKFGDSSPFVEVPLYGSIAAGAPSEMIETQDRCSIPGELEERYPGCFLLKVAGESMNRILPNGCYALIAPCNDVDVNGAPYAVCVNGYDATIKRVRKLNNGYELSPDSDDPTFKTVLYDYNDESTDLITVIGRVVWYRIPNDWRF